jgi:Domain of unknown function (DUF4387)
MSENMKKLSELALVRSKVAGPFHICFDVIFHDRGAYEHVKATGQLTSEEILKVYKIETNDFIYSAFDPALTIKCTVPRAVPSGGVGDWDVYGTQQSQPLRDKLISVEAK